MRRSLVIYDFSPDPSEFPNIWGKFSLLFYQCAKQIFHRTVEDTILHSPAPAFTACTLKCNLQILICVQINTSLNTASHDKSDFNSSILLIWLRVRNMVEYKHEIPSSEFDSREGLGGKLKRPGGSACPLQLPSQFFHTRLQPFSCS